MKLVLQTPHPLYHRLLDATERAHLERVLADALGAGTRLVAMEAGKLRWERGGNGHSEGIGTIRQDSEPGGLGYLTEQDVEAMVCPLDG